MLLMVIKRFDGKRVIHKFIKSDNLEDVKNKYKNKRYVGIEYIGDILRERQKQNLINYGNTVLPNAILNQLSQKDILKEVERLTGLKCCIEVKASGTVVLHRC